MMFHDIRRVLCGLVVAGLLGWVSVASAQQGSAASGETAQQYFERGARAFYKEDYAKALLEFRKAYQRREDPRILYNMSLAYLKLGNIEGSLDAAMRAQKKGGMPKKMQVRNQSRLRALQVIVGAKGYGQAIAAAQRSGNPNNSNPTAATAASPGEPGADGLGALGWTGVATTAVGVGALSFAVIVNQQLGAEIDTYEQAGPGGWQAQRDTISDKKTLGQVALYSGAGLAAAGLTMWIVDLVGSGETGESAVDLDVAAGPDTQMVQLRWMY